jgi:hypothetical protein
MSQVIIYSMQDGGVGIVIPTGEIPIAKVLLKDVPKNTDAVIVDVSRLPNDTTFRDAWEKTNQTVSINLNKAKNIAHDRRRFAREEEFKPWDVKATIPSEAAQAEAERQKIRNKYAVMQTKINAAKTVEELKALLP